MPDVDDMSFADGGDVNVAERVRLYEPSDIEGL